MQRTNPYYNNKNDSPQEIADKLFNEGARFFLDIPADEFFFEKKQQTQIQKSQLRHHTLIEIIKDDILSANTLADRQEEFMRWVNVLVQCNKNHDMESVFAVRIALGELYDLTTWNVTDKKKPQPLAGLASSIDAALLQQWHTISIDLNNAKRNKLTEQTIPFLGDLLFRVDLIKGIKDSDQKYKLQKNFIADINTVKLKLSHGTILIDTNFSSSLKITNKLKLYELKIEHETPFVKAKIELVSLYLNNISWWQKQVRNGGTFLGVPHTVGEMHKIFYTNKKSPHQILDEICMLAKIAIKPKFCFFELFSGRTDATQKMYKILSELKKHNIVYIKKTIEAITDTQRKSLTL